MLLLLAAGALLLLQERPPDNFVSKDQCPFECCVYRQWTANRDVALLENPGGREIQKIAKGTKVLGVTGEVHIPHPQRRVTRITDEARTVPPGATVYLLHNLGEGYWLVWYRGKLVALELYPEEPYPEYTWWAKVRTASGRTGWVDMTSPMPFDNVDQCG